MVTHTFISTAASLCKMSQILSLHCSALSHSIHNWIIRRGYWTLTPFKRWHWNAQYTSSSSERRSQALYTPCFLHLQWHEAWQLPLRGPELYSLQSNDERDRSHASPLSQCTILSEVLSPESAPGFSVSSVSSFPTVKTHKSFTASYFAEQGFLNQTSVSKAKMCIIQIDILPFRCSQHYPHNFWGTGHTMQ